MSLKAVHIFFIAVSVLLLLGFGVWCLRMFSLEADPRMVIVATISFLSAVVLIVYGIRFLKKLKGISFL